LDRRVKGVQSIRCQKLLPSWYLAPELNEDFVIHIEGMFEVQQSDHQAGGQARTSGIGDASTDNRFGRARQVRVFKLLASAQLAGKEGANVAAIPCQGMWLAKTASG
jgi:hypothetical protein